MNEGFERRRTLRLQAESDFKDSTWAHATDGLLRSLFRKRYPCTLIDISKGGLGILSNEPVKNGAYIDITVCYKEFQPFVVSSRVRSCNVYDSVTIDGNEIKYYKIGLQIELCTNDVMNRIQKVVHRISLRQPTETS